MTSSKIVPLSLKDAPSLIEKILPAQRLSIESYKEQMAVHGKTLTALGSYWKGRKPLILNKACILGCLLPATADLRKDLQVFEKLMGMDMESFPMRYGRAKPTAIIQRVALEDLYLYFKVDPEDVLPPRTPIDLSEYALENGNLPEIQWRENVPETEKLRLEAQSLPSLSYRELVETSSRPESCPGIHDHIWHDVNTHLGTDAHSIPELVEQLGIMRFGHRPRFADTFAGSGQIPFEAARLGCDTYASDLNPIACMLTWGAFNIVGGSPEHHAQMEASQKDLFENVQREIDSLGIETDGRGWRGKVYLYCLEAKCPSTGWMVPLLPTRVVSKGYRVVAELVPDNVRKRYDILIKNGASDDELIAAEIGTVRSDGPGQDPYMIHTVDGVDYKTNISTLRGDFTKADGTTGNRLRLWEKDDFVPRPDDIFKERLYAIEWMRPKKNKKGNEFEFRSVTAEDLARERIVENYVKEHLAEWQNKGWVPDMRIEPGSETERLYRERGWTYWHHLFNPRQLLLGALVNRRGAALSKFGLAQVLNNNCRSSRWHPGGGGGGLTAGVFDNQALNTLFNYGCRGTGYAANFLCQKYKNIPFAPGIRTEVLCMPADRIDSEHDIYVTDPPYGDAVKYEEILEFFIAWLRKNPPPEFANWIWDSRRSLAIKGQDEDFRNGMVAAYKRMAEKMPDNGIQVIMFTHQSGAIWADMANIVWASGLQVTAAWYVATEVDSVLKGGQYVKGTVLLVCRKRLGTEQTTRDDVAWEIRDEVRNQVATMTGLNQETKGLHRDENLFEDADLQMAGYAAALRVLTKYSTIDGKDMAVESMRPRAKGQKTFVDDLIDFAVDVANQCLVPQGIRETTWDKLKPAERFYLKMAQMEARGIHTLDNYQNFAKAFKVKDFGSLMASSKANSARLKSAVELGKSEMSRESQLGDTKVRAVLYAVYEVAKNVDIDEVVGHLSNLMPDYFNSRNVVVELADYLALCFDKTHPEEARAARVLRERVKNQTM